jgi:hypothetical protein
VTHETPRGLHFWYVNVFYGYGKESVGTVLLAVTLFLMVLAMGGDEDE